MSSESPEYTPIEGDDAREQPVRLLLVQGDHRPAVDATDEPMVMTFPHLLVREAIAFLALSLLLVTVSILFDAPLEEIANPDRTPNPAKAPWYFLGLQELLHYYPPIVSGVLLPALLIVALVVVPYFGVNIERQPLWKQAVRRRMASLWAVVAAFTLILVVTPAHPVWPIIIPLILVAAVMSLGALPGWRDSALGRRSLAFWIFTWFLLIAVVLTIIGVFFRGPGWSFTLPWREGIF